MASPSTLTIFYLCFLSSHLWTSPKDWRVILKRITILCFGLLFYNAQYKVLADVAKQAALEAVHGIDRIVQEEWPLTSLLSAGQCAGNFKT